MMTSFFGAAFWFVVTIGVLVTFHEFGHFWVARRCGVRVLKFSIGFGRPLWSRIAADGTKYQVAAIPQSAIRVLNAALYAAKSSGRDAIRVHRRAGAPAEPLSIAGI